ncbi:muconolactone Delta-isomerase family protein [Rhodococcus opacus]|uniref:muconolactone Delta-isomerase family protein n=1 Tax=Rhodococcus opacus TaxID=37919 RepID=UPI0006BB4B7F|nr:muconolactone Delta-isomerase family protein [Rhodococcus opacus]MDJ0420232.1 muconolactone Delta-isomerase family protein [Rhodococcus opacus]MDV7090103.1 muconolactone Delta-isomerase family protein [Rhodococcus opacus]WKN52644.1 muconolactone Delta-isomerase family protein [Rhodococcus opacus]
MKEFLVEMRTAVPESVDPAVRSRLGDDKSAAIARLTEEGKVTRLRRTSDDNKPYTIGFWTANDQVEFRQLIEQLPMYPWMRITMRPLTSHRFDPSRMS